MHRFAFVILCAALGVVAFHDLQGPEQSFESSETTGSVRLPLTGRGPDGTIYRLRNATFEITGAAMLTVSDRDSADTRAETLSTTVPPGNYSVFLRQGWELYVESATGQAQKAEATLVSSNPSTFEIGRSLDARLTLTVRTGATDVVLGGAAPEQVTRVDNDSNDAL